MSDVPFTEDWGKAIAATEGRAGVHDLMGTGIVQKSTLPAKFSLKPHLSRFQTEKAGRPIYTDELRITIYQPGGDSVCRPVKPEDKLKWPEAWDAYQRGAAQAVTGTPLEQWPLMTPSVVQNLKSANVLSVEGLAELPDASCEVIGNYAFDFRKKAIDYLAHAAGTDTRLDELKAENAEMAETLKAMQAKIAELEKPKRRGRPRKVKTNVATDNDPGRNRPAVASDAIDGDRESEPAG